MKKKICPRCGSTNISTIQKGTGLIVGVKPSYHCQDCGYEHFVFPEIDE